MRGPTCSSVAPESWRWLSLKKASTSSSVTEPSFSTPRRMSSSSPMPCSWAFVVTSRSAMRASSAWLRIS